MDVVIKSEDRKLQSQNALSVKKHHPPPTHTKHVKLASMCLLKSLIWALYPHTGQRWSQVTGLTSHMDPACSRAKTATAFTVTNVTLNP